jgi:uncharacterized protein (UPF0335 family)
MMTAAKIAEKHNAGVRAEKPGADVGDNRAHRFAKDQLKAFIERVERLEEERQTFTDDIKDVYKEAKGTGFDVKCLKAIVKLRKQDPEKRAEYEAILETYMLAMGMLD